MRQSEGEFTNEAGVTIFTRQWAPERPPRAGILLVHGLGEHCGRYDHLAEYFTAQGYLLWSLDHPGHGRSGGQRAYIKQFSHFTSTLRQYSDQIRALHPELPLFLYGHSMGGLMSVHFLAEHQAYFRGAVLASSAVSIPSHVSAVTIFAGRILSQLLPRLGLVPLDSSGVSRDPAVVEAYNADPLIYHGKITARLGAQIMMAMQSAGEAAARIRLPVLTMNGTADQLVDPGDTPRLHALLPDDIDKTLRQYPGLFHELHNEPEQAQVFSDVAAWFTGLGVLKS